MAALRPVGNSSNIHFLANHSSMEDFFPEEILDAIGGVQAIEMLEKIEEEVPEYSANFPPRYWDEKKHDWILRFSEPEGSAIRRGFDKKGRPFLVAYIPKYFPLGFYTSSNCSKPADFKDLKNWWVGQHSSGGSWGGSIQHIERSNPLLLLSQIAKGEDCQATRKEISLY